MARGFVSLPQYRAPGPLNFEPLNRGIDALGQGIEKNRLLREQAQLQSEERQRQSEDRQRQAVAFDQQSRAFDQQSRLRGLQIEGAEDDLRAKLVQRTTGIARHIMSESDPERKATMAQRFFTAHPRFRQQLDAYGVDISDPDKALGFLIAEAGTEQKQQDMPSAVREYQFAMQQRQQVGQPPIPYDDWKQTSTAPLVRIDGERAYDKTRGEALAKDFASIQEGEQEARSRIGQLRQIDALLSDPSVYTGTGASAINALKRAGQTLFGMDIEGVESADAARRVSTEMALSLRTNLPGPMSDGDREFLMAIPPSIGDTAQGRRLLIDLMVQREQRKIEMADLARKYRDEHGRIDDGWYDVAARWSRENPMFDESVMSSAREAAASAQQQRPYAGVRVEMGGRKYEKNPQTGEWVEVE